MKAELKAANEENERLSRLLEVAVATNISISLKETSEVIKSNLVKQIQEEDFEIQHLRHRLKEKMKIRADLRGQSSSDGDSF
jgi:hypothetical protein